MIPAAALLLLLAVGEPVPEPPRCVADGSGLELKALPTVLDESEVQRQLYSGLTTSVNITIEARAAPLARSSRERLTIRYEPWDEIFVVERRSTRGVAEHADLESLADLEAWWRNLTFALSEAPGAGWRATLRIAIVPFSEAERDDAQRWFARSAHGGTTPGPDGRPREEDNGRVESLLELAMSTAIEPHTILTRSWKLHCTSP